MTPAKWTSAAALLFALLAGCGPGGSDSGAVDAAVTGLSIVPSEGGFRLTLERAAFDRAFLLAPAIAKGPPLAISTAYPARIVRFQHKGDQIYLFEDTAAGLIGTTSLPAHRLLAKFDVLSHAESGRGDGASAVVTIDFNTGINDFLLEMLVESGDLNGAPNAPVPDYIVSSAINKVYVHGEDLYVDQIVEMHQSGQAAPPVIGQVKYTLSPYAENTAFPKRANSSQSFGKVGFFENQRPFTDAAGYDSYFVNKWDLTKPIVFHLPTTIPDDFKAAVRDGVLYWNKVFGHDYVQVADKPADVTPHEPGYNVVQWLDTSALDFAYADWTADPRTGETRQAQIFVPSYFAVASREDAARVLTNGHADRFAGLKYAAAGGDPLPAMRAGLARANHAACFDGMRATYAKAMADLLLTTDADDEAVKRFSQDVIRQVVAHEIGHALGLRHNFRAKTGATVPFADLTNVVANYMKTGNPPAGQTITTSVMDYLPMEYNALSGAMIRLGAGPFKYDQAAIAWGYTMADHRTLDFGGFCSDEAEGSFPDCVKFATPGPSIQATLTTWANARQTAVSDLAVQFINGKAPPDKSAPIQVEEVPLKPDRDAADVLGPLRYMSSMLRDFKELGASWLTVADTFKYVSDFNREAEEAAILKFQTDAVAAIGGVEALIKPLIPVQRADKTYRPGLLVDVEAQFQAEVASASFAQGTAANGTAYAFTPAERTYVNGIAAPYYERLAEELLTGAIATLTSVEKGKYAGFDPVGLSAQFKALATAILTAEAAEQVTGKAAGVDVTSAKPYYKHELMMAACALLGGDLFDAFPDQFNKGVGVDVAAALQKKLDAITSNGTVPPEALEGPIKKLAFELDEVIQTIPNKVAGP